MSEKKSILDDIMRKILSSIFNKIFKDLQERVDDYITGIIKPYISDIIRAIIKKIIISIIGTSLIIIGVVFLCVSLVKYCSIYFPPWMAWGLVGIIILIIGCIAALVGLRR